MKRLVLLLSFLSAPLIWAQNASADFEKEIAAVVAGPQGNHRALLGALVSGL